MQSTAADAGLWHKTLPIKKHDTAEALKALGATQIIRNHRLCVPRLVLIHTPCQHCSDSQEAYKWTHQACSCRDTCGWPFAHMHRNTASAAITAPPTAGLQTFFCANPQSHRAHQRAMAWAGSLGLGRVAQAASQLHVLGHDGDALGVDGA